MTSQTIVVYENLVTPAPPAAGYRGAYPAADGWKEIDSAGVARYFARLDSDNVSMTVAGGLNIGSATLAPVGSVDVQKDQDAATYIRVQNGNNSVSAVSRVIVTSNPLNTNGLVLFSAPAAYTGITEFAGKAGLYTFASTGNLVLASRAAAGGIDFYVGGSAAANKLMVVAPAGVTISTRVGVGTAPGGTHVFQIDGAFTTSGIAMYVNRNAAAASTDSPVVYFRQQNAGDDQHTLQIAQAGGGHALYIESGTLRFDGQNSTGTGTPTFANNKPTASSSTATWLKVNLGGNTYYIPCWS